MSPYTVLHTILQPGVGCTHTFLLDLLLAVQQQLLTKHQHGPVPYPQTSPLTVATAPLTMSTTAKPACLIYHDTMASLILINAGTPS